MQGRGKAGREYHDVSRHRRRRSACPEWSRRSDADRSRSHRLTGQGKPDALLPRLYDRQRLFGRGGDQERQRRPLEVARRRPQDHAGHRQAKGYRRKIRDRSILADRRGGQDELRPVPSRIRRCLGRLPGGWESASKFAFLSFVAAALLAGCGQSTSPGQMTLGQIVAGGSPVAGQSASWPIEFVSYVFSGFLLAGALTAVQITVLAMSAGLVLGLGLALVRLSSVAPLRAAAWTYIWMVRGTPQLLQLVFIYDALPLIGLKFDSFTTAVVGFALNEAAFSAEIIRGGIVSVSRNQSIAAASLGMGPFLTLRRIILPQAMRAITPGVTNDTIGMLKLSSIASVIFVNELTFRAQQIVGQNFKFFTVFCAAGVIYLAMTSAVSLLQGWVERHFDPERDRGRPRRRGSVAETFARALAPSRDGLPRGARNGVSELHDVLTTDDVVARIGEPFLVSSNVWKSYGGREVLSGIDL